MKKYLFTVFLCLIINTTEALPSAFYASYKISARELIIGNMKASLIYTGNQYKYHKINKSTGLASFLSGDKSTENIEGTFCSPCFYRNETDNFNVLSSSRQQY